MKILFNEGEIGGGGAPQDVGDDGGGSSPKMYSEESFKLLIKQRDEHKQRANDLQVQFDEINAKIKLAEQKELEKNGDLQKIIDNLRNEIKAAEKFKTSFEELEKTMKDDLISKVKPEHKVFAEGLTIEQLRDFVRLNPATSFQMDGGKSGPGAIVTDGMKWDDFTVEALNIINQQNPTAYRRLFSEKFANKKSFLKN